MGWGHTSSTSAAAGVGYATVNQSGTLADAVKSRVVYTLVFLRSSGASYRCFYRSPIAFVKHDFLDLLCGSAGAHTHKKINGSNYDACAEKSTQSPANSCPSIDGSHAATMLSNRKASF